MGNMTEADMSFIVDLIDVGKCDDHIEVIIEAACARRRFLAKMAGAQNQIAMNVNDRVRLISPISPKYLTGVTGTVSPRRAHRPGDIMVTLDYSAGRFSGTISVPANCLEAE